MWIHDSVADLSRRASALALLSFAALLLHSAPAHADRPAAMSAQTIKLPSGPSSLKGLGESFSTDAATGTGSFSVPIEVAPALLAPKVSLSYAAGQGKGALGLSWDLPVLQIYRTTDKGFPKFTETDRFAVSGAGLNDELVLVDAVTGTYRLKNEGAFALFIRNAGSNSWTIRMPDGETLYLGESCQARQYVGTACQTNTTYRWLLERHADRFGYSRSPSGHEIRYTYLRDQGRCYLQQISYQSYAAAAFQNTVVFSYESRPDSFFDYSYGSRVTTGLRLSNIVVRQGARTLRTYQLGYRNSVTFSVLTSVSMTGEGGLSMPTLSYDYLEPDLNAGRFVEMVSRPAIDGLWNGTAQLEDMNRDGLPDLLVGTAGNYRYYENLDGVSWGANAIPLSGSPDRGLFDSDMVLADFDGDGDRDVGQSHNGGFRYYPAGEVWRGVFQGYGSAVTLSTTESGFNLTSPEVKLSDLNSDGRIDLIWQKPGQDGQLTNVGNSLVSSLITELPSDINFQDSRVELRDFNGDGVLDFVRKEIGYNPSRVRVWFGLGNGAYTSEQQMGNVPTGDAGDFYFEDVNRDGQSDLIRISGSQVTYYLNDGKMMFTGARGDFRGLPSMAYTRKVLFADMNGNGTSDVVWVTTDDRLLYLDLVSQPFFGYLSRIDNGMGAITEIAYRSSTEYLVEAKRKGAPWSTTLQVPVGVISEVATSDSLERLGAPSPESRTTYSYAQGYYDGKEREYRGFGLVSTTEWGDETHESLVSETRLHVGRNLLSGADEEVLKGKPYLSVLKNTQGQVYTSEETSWEQRWLCQESLTGVAQDILPRCANYPDRVRSKDSLVSVAVATTTLTGAWEKTSTPRYSAVVTEYDAWSHAIRVRNHGEVTFSGARTLGAGIDLGEANTSFGSDEVVSETDLIHDVGDWLIGLPYQERKLTTGGRLLSQSRSFFDGERYVGLPLGQVDRGLVTREEVWLDVGTADGDVLGACSTGATSGNRWIATKRHEYNGDGLLVSGQDAKSNLTDIAYDTDTHSFPVLERHYVQSGTIEYRAKYDPGYGAVLESVDANAKVTKYTYDGLGRSDKVFDPLSSLAVPSVDYDYEYGTSANPISKTTIKTLVDRGVGSYRTSYQYSDGLGRLRLTKTQAEGSYGYIGSGFVQVTARGGANRGYDNFASSEPGFEAPPVGTPVVTRKLDALSRAVEAVFPATQDLAQGTVSTTYLPFESREYDERDTSNQSWQYGTVTRVDGLGRTRELEKKNDQQGAVRTLLWKADYDPLGRIVAFKDPAWTENANSATRDARSKRVYSYDSLSRLVDLVDPNLGHVVYNYDDVGNLVTRKDDAGQREVWEYELGNRVSKRSFCGDLTGKADYSYSYHYDVAAPNSPLPNATNLLGQLTWVEFPTGREYYSFDEEGRQIDEVVELWNPATSNFAQQSRDAFRRSTTLNADGNVTNVALPGGFTIANQYNTRGLLSGMLGGPAGATRSILSNITYDVRGAATRTDHGNGTRSCSSFDTRGQLTGIITGKSSEVSCSDLLTNYGKGFQHQRYVRTYNGNIASIQDLSTQVRDGAGNLTVPRLDATYRYDRLNQLTFASDSQGAFTFDYDSTQNLISRTFSGTATSLPTGNFSYGERGAGPNMLTAAGGKSYDYDAVGRMKSYNGYALDYDVEGRLVTATKGTTSIRYHYDLWGGRRLAVVQRGAAEPEVTRFVFAEYELRNGDETWLLEGGSASVEATKSKGVVVDDQLFLLNQLRDYATGAARNPKPLPAEYMDFDGDGDFDMSDYDIANTAYGTLQRERLGGEKLIWRYHHRDQLSGSTHSTDSVGDLVSHVLYDVYGKTTQPKGLTPIVGYAGAKQEPERDLGLMHFGARYYAPELGRWTTADRFLGESGSRAWSTLLEANLYSYAANNPVIRRDVQGTNSDKASGSWSFKSFALWVDEKVGTANIDKAAVIASGVAQIAGGTLEMIAGAAAIAAPEPVLTKVGGALALAHGADTATAGLNTLMNGEPTRTLTAQGVTALASAAGASPEHAEMIGNVGDAMVGIGAQRLMIQASLSRAAAPAAMCTGTRCVVGSGKCFVAGTPIATPNGAVAIETLRPGDQVLAFDFVSNRLQAFAISAVFVRSTEELLEITLGDDVIETTAEHPFWVEGRGWVTALELQVGDRLRSGDGIPDLVTAVRLREVEPTSVYNFRVDIVHNYLVGDDQVLVHNTDCGTGGLKQALRKQLAKIEELATTPGNSGTATTMSSREVGKLADRFLGPGAKVVWRGKQGELWKQSADGRRLVRMPSNKTSPHARTGKQANFHERANAKANFFDKQQSSNVHVHVQN